MLCHEHSLFSRGCVPSKFVISNSKYLRYLVRQIELCPPAPVQVGGRRTAQITSRVGMLHRAVNSFPVDDDRLRDFSIRKALMRDIQVHAKSRLTRCSRALHNSDFFELEYTFNVARRETRFPTYVQCTDPVLATRQNRRRSELQSVVRSYNFLAIKLSLYDANLAFLLIKKNAL